MAYMLENPYWIVIIIALIILTIFVCIKAGAASSKRYKANEAIMKKLKEENILRNEFAVLTDTLIHKSEPSKLFKGVALNLQKKISDAVNMNAEFDKLNDEQKSIYALSYVIEDGSENLSNFFKANGQPLTGSALTAFKNLFSGKAAEIFEYEYNAFDENNEDASVIPEEIKKNDTDFALLVSAETICETAGKFIKENAEKFI
ncbi:MAG: hypothetical protein E7547_04995 [Ruminococcaceae bacterium]|nr:hypothetical protein [Oscillospiraceae bacterium]